MANDMLLRLTTVGEWRLQVAFGTRSDADITLHQEYTNPVP